MISAYDAMRAISRERGDSLAITTCTPAQYWSAVSERSELDIQLPGTMGKASSLALGLALSRPERNVLVLDGDGSILMNMGSLVTVAGKRPKNFIHFVFQDGEYFTTGRQPIPAANTVNLAQAASEAGYQNSHDFDNLKDFVSQLGEIMGEEGPTFVCLRVDHPEGIPSYVSGPLLNPKILESL